MNVLIIKFKSVVTAETKEAMLRKVNDALDNHGVIVLDDSCDYEFVDFERRINNDKE